MTYLQSCKIMYFSLKMTYRVVKLYMSVLRDDILLASQFRERPHGTILLAQTIHCWTTNDTQQKFYFCNAKGFALIRCGVKPGHGRVIRCLTSYRYANTTLPTSTGNKTYISTKIKTTSSMCISI